VGCCDRVVPELDSGRTLQTECHARATGARGFIFRFEHKLYRWRILPARPPACTPPGTTHALKLMTAWKRACRRQLAAGAQGIRHTS
jgi:hypothetical protein